jgi:hypothetical protein
MEKNLKLSNNLNSIEEICTISHLQDVNTDLILMMLGQKIGSGSYRSVYNYNMNDKLVVKIEPNSTEQNISEFIMWDEIRGLKEDKAWVKDWFAPIHWCSPNGKILIMEKTFQKNKPKPKEIPKFLSDVKSANFGWIGNKYVCHDYGFIYPFIEYKKSFKKVIW